MLIPLEGERPSAESYAALPRNNFIDGHVWEKLAQLGVKLEAVYYTQGRYDFVDIVEATEPDALLTFSLWYISQGYGRVESMPAFDTETLAGAADKV